MICAFRELLARSFAQVIELSARCGVLKVGAISVALDKNSSLRTGAPMTVGIALLIEMPRLPSLDLYPCSGPAIRAVHFLQLK